VLSVGTTEGQGTPYDVKDVPNVMYINYDAEALHGAYWHNNFGHRMSHGCINLPLDVAAFLYEWAPVGTAVTVIN
jgi:lipoprotein-anchoring transpeptidase ErfK/SrfK